MKTPFNVAWCLIMLSTIAFADTSPPHTKPMDAAFIAFLLEDEALSDDKQWEAALAATEKTKDNTPTNENEYPHHD